MVEVVQEVGSLQHGRIMYNKDMEEQYQLDLIKAIQETKDGEVSVIQLPIELISTSTMCQ